MQIVYMNYIYQKIRKGPQVTCLISGLGLGYSKILAVGDSNPSSYISTFGIMVLNLLLLVL